jgi:hypothetical protein
MKWASSFYIKMFGIKKMKVFRKKISFGELRPFLINFTAVCAKTKRCKAPLGLGGKNDEGETLKTWLFNFPSMEKRFCRYV